MSIEFPHDDDIDYPHVTPPKTERYHWKELDYGFSDKSFEALQLTKTKEK